MTSKFGRKQLVLASLVLALGAAVYLNWQFAGTNKLPVGEDTGDTSSKLGAAQLVNNAYVETVSDNLQDSTQVNTTTNSFAQARLDRQTSRDEALELLDNVLADTEADSDEKKAAVEQASALAQNILTETNIEGLLKAKGYEECVAYVADNQCSVVVSGDLKDSDMLVVQEVVMEQTGFSAEKIIIIGSSK
ncbi:SpoIIIAH-like family protein [Acutalibacter caecimuris]|uniref:SpoIIIAH-like family protein n=1 Tax=Acutalibacter caecimuris TaxID=3093657 RepID=UPI002AC92F05|nr:SpoIIIAH-like family protein [Acutalibacter sp. M00118]